VIILSSKQAPTAGGSWRGVFFNIKFEPASALNEKIVRKTNELKKFLHTNSLSAGKKTFIE